MSQPWTPAEDALLRELNGTMTARQAGERIGRPLASVKARRVKLGIANGRMPPSPRGGPEITPAPIGPGVPTDTIPATDDRLAVLRARAARGEALFNPRDYRAYHGAGEYAARCWREVAS